MLEVVQAVPGAEINNDNGILRCGSLYKQDVPELKSVF